ncbi:MAG: hypothetical protein K2K98_01970 [Muribaculaceae bacterium]|nr:hypothetical protein [Muribaculaceae bacterium]
MDKRKLFLIGANFTDAKETRGLEYEIIAQPNLKVKLSQTLKQNTAKP